MKAVADERLAELRAMPYAEYLLTPEWRQRRNLALARALWQCEWPGCRAKDGLEVHHKSYEHLGDETAGELSVLCGGHHRGYHERWDVRLVLIRSLMKSSGYASFADFAEAVKAACIRHDLPYDDNQFREAMRRVEHDLQIEAGRPAPPTALAALDRTAPSTSEARSILAKLREKLGVVPVVKEVPNARPLRRATAARLKALAFVAQEIHEAEERCAALEKEP